MTPDELDALADGAWVRVDGGTFVKEAGGWHTHPGGAFTLTSTELLKFGDATVTEGPQS